MIFDTRVGNCLFTQVIVAEFCAVFFANLGLMISVVIYEVRFRADRLGITIEGNAITTC